MWIHFLRFLKTSFEFPESRKLRLVLGAMSGVLVGLQQVAPLDLRVWTVFLVGGVLIARRNLWIWFLFAWSSAIVCPSENFLVYLGSAALVSNWKAAVLGIAVAWLLTYLNGTLTFPLVGILLLLIAFGLYGRRFRFGSL